MRGQGLKYIRAKHPAICWPLLPWFVEGDQTREEIFLELYGRLEQDPDDIFVEIALDGDICKGILISYVSDDHIWIWQARTAKDFRQPEKLLDDLISWAKQKKITKLRAGCSNDKSMKLFMRRYGFKKEGSEIQRDIA